MILCRDHTSASKKIMIIGLFKEAVNDGHSRFFKNYRKREFTFPVAYASFLHPWRLPAFVSYFGSGYSG